MTGRRFALAVSLMFATGCASARPGRDPLVSDRPDFTEAPETMAPREVQVEGGYTFARTAREQTHTTGEILTRIGLAPRVELRIEPGSYSTLSSPVGDSRGVEDAGLGVKLGLHDARDAGPSLVPALSVILMTSVPTGSRAFRQSAMQPEAKLVTAWTLTDRLGFAANVNVARPVEDRRRFTEWAGSASLGITLTERYGTYVEVFGFEPQLRGAATTKYANTGLTAALTPNFQLDVRAGVGFNRTGPDYFVGAGFARRW
jgi:hypothetical protein